MPGLLRMYSMIDTLSDPYWRNIKLNELEHIIASVLGLHLEASADEPSAAPGEEIKLKLEVANRSPYSARLLNVYYAPTQDEQSPERLIMNNQVFKWERTIKLPEDLPTTDPYWLKSSWDNGMYNVPDPRMIGLPEAPRYVQIIFEFGMGDEVIRFTRPVHYKYVDPARGEVNEPFQITHPLYVTAKQNVVVFADTFPKTISVVLTSKAPDQKGILRLNLPDMWKVTPDSIPYHLESKGQENQYTFEVTPPDTISNGIIEVYAESQDGKTFNRNYSDIDYDHITKQFVSLPAEIKVNKLDFVRVGQQIGYIMGAGDDVPKSLEQIGYDVSLIDDEELMFGNLEKYDAIISGIRAYNTREKLKFGQGRLNEYVKNGGTYIVQYNTNRGLVTEDIAPYILKLSRFRVTDETAPVEILEEKHVLVNYPNRITQADFDGWVQERGLYFGGEWSTAFMPILAMNDPGEESYRGSLLAMKYGEGFYIYTGLSFFRQLPAGVPGAFRIMANLIAVGQLNKS
jgi:hypothetical protein